MDLPVIIEKVVFRSEKGFAILAATLNPYSPKYKPDLEDLLLKNIRPNSYNNFTITIDLMDPHAKVENAQYICIGDFIRHPKYGEQYKCTFMYPDEPVNEDGLKICLMNLPNIKEARSSSILKRFGVEETIRILNEDVNKLLEINGITENRIPPIKDAWDRSKGERELFIWLNDHGIQPQIGKKIYSIWKHDSLKVLTENPYCLIEIRGFGFARADLIAHKIFQNIPKDMRTIACMKHVLDEDLRKNSNLCMSYSSLKEEVIKELRNGSEQNAPSIPFCQDDYIALIPECIKKSLKIFTAVKNIHEQKNGTYVYLKSIWDKEKFIGESIYNRSLVEEVNENNEKDNAPVEMKKEDVFSCTDKDLDDAEKDVGLFNHHSIQLDDCQKDAIRSVFKNKISVITGPGGSGKSSICRCIFHLAHEKGLSVRMLSPTGKAAKVLSDKTGFTAETIHRSLKMKPGNDKPGVLIQEDIVVVDEASMVGIDTMYAIMYALQENIWAHIVFVGDCNQLPSVSPGNFLSDIMKSNCVNVVRLDKIHRQDEKSYIPLLANDIAKGKVVEIPSDASDIKWHHLTSENWDISLRRIIKDFIQEGNNIDDLQLVAPIYRGLFGVNKANEVVQDLMAQTNGVKNNHFARGFMTFYIGDRVIQTENNYEKEIFNGDIGKIVDFGRKATDPNSDEKKDFITVNFYGENITFVEDEIDQLRLAWCCTVHKFQGSQSPHMVCILSSEAQNMMTKELLYTALTRSSKHLDIYGHMSAFRLAPTKSAIRHRNTHVNDIIRELRENIKILKVLE